MNEPLVYLVGAGPGNPGLLTLRALECLQRADLVIYDKLIPSSILEYIPAAVERVRVSDLPSEQTHRYPQIHYTMIEAARQGKCVVRLKGGDPFLFGRGGEEAEALRKAGIAYEVVPGITAAIGAAAYAGIPLTHRLHASAVAFVTGHENPLKPESCLDWAALARFPGTLAIYMGMSRLPRIIEALVAHGKPPDTPAAAVHWATTGDQQTIEAPLAQLAEAIQHAGLTAPAIIFIGSVVRLRREISWFEQRPLFNARVVVTRPRRQASDLARRLEELGAVPHLLPAVEVRDPADWAPVDDALQRLASYHWLVFTSVNGVHSFLRRLRRIGMDLRALGTLRLAAIGPATAEALREYHLDADIVPDEYRSEALAAALKPQVAGQRVLLARADRGRELLRDELGHGAEVDQIAVYSQVDALDTSSHVFDSLRRGEVDYVTLTSSNIARAFLRGLDAPCRARIEAGDVRLASISPITSAAVRELGFEVAVEATSYTTKGLVEALVAFHTARVVPE